MCWFMAEWGGYRLGKQINEPNDINKPILNSRSLLNRAKLFDSTTHGIKLFLHMIIFAIFSTCKNIDAEVKVISRKNIFRH